MDTLTLDDFARVYSRHQRAKRAHLIPADAWRDVDVMSLCGRKFRNGDDWRGARVAERRSAQNRPICADCTRVAQKLVAAPAVPAPRLGDVFTEPGWCLSCGRTRIVDGEFEWVTALDGWQHRWRFCAEDLRYERLGLTIPALAIPESMC